MISWTGANRKPQPKRPESVSWTQTVSQNFWNRVLNSKHDHCILIVYSCSLQSFKANLYIQFDFCIVYGISPWSKFRFSEFLNWGFSPKEKLGLKITTIAISVLQRTRNIARDEFMSNRILFAIFWHAFYSNGLKPLLIAFMFQKIKKRMKKKTRWQDVVRWFKLLRALH